MFVLVVATAAVVDVVCCCWLLLLLLLLLLVVVAAAAAVVVVATALVPVLQIPPTSPAGVILSGRVHLLAFCGFSLAFTRLFLLQFLGEIVKMLEIQEKKPDLARGTMSENFSLM